MHESFEASAYEVDSDDLIKPVNVWMGTAEDDTQITMSIHPQGDCVVHITKEQAMKFFGLVDPTDQSQNDE